MTAVVVTKGQDGKLAGMGEKGASLVTARTLYPSAPLKLAKHHNRAEALLIAHYGRAVLG